MKYFKKRSFRVLAGLIALGGLVLGCPLIPGLTWYRHIGEEAGDGARAIARTADGGFIVAGYAEPTAEEDNNAILVKLDVMGLEEWKNEFGDGRNDIALSVAVAKDGGYVVAGRFGDESDATSDAFLLKTDAQGVTQWQKTFDSGGQDQAYSVQPTADGGYILGLQLDILGDTTPVLLKTDALGVEQWRITGPVGCEIAPTIPTNDGGYLMAWWKIIPGALLGALPQGEVGLLKADTTGTETWRKTIASNVAVIIEDVRETYDGGFVLAGCDDLMAMGANALLWKVSSTGEVLWQKTYDADGRVEIHTVRQTWDGGFVMVGDLYPGNQSTDIILLKTDASGTQSWQRLFGGNDIDNGYDVVQTCTLGFVVAGESQSLEEEGDPDNANIFVFKTDPTGHNTAIEVEAITQ